MTPSWGESGFELRSGDPESRRPTWPRVLVLVGIFVLALIVSRGCQDEQVQVTEQEAVEIAREQVDFEPTRTNVRLLRQGLDRQPFWFVQLSIPIGDPESGLFEELTIVQIETETGDVVSVKRQSKEDAAEARRQAAEQERQLEAEQAEGGASQPPDGAGE